MELRPIEITRPGRRELSRAARFLIAGPLGEDLADAQAQTLLARLRMDGAMLFWACREASPVAAAAILPSAGNVGMLLLSPLRGGGVDADALAATVAAAGAESLQRGAAFVQALADPGAHGESEVLARAGMTHAATLAYMRLDLRAGALPPAPAIGGLGWHSGLDFGDDRLSAVIAASYEQSLDCPGILGVRTRQEVLAGHRANGTYRRECWWVATIDGQDAGCILVNDSVPPGGGEVAYLGVAAGFRRRGLGRCLLEKAAFQAIRRGSRYLALAVDEHNAPAVALYRGAGFSLTHRRAVWVKLPAKNPTC
ncbi:MAG: GNAT family N-acetyltransferase [Planctomycetota bacterium]|nr:GNAT family N-acetyltransferase [Planctomycetota bacterium]